MWTKTHTIEAKGITAAQVWKIWSDVSKRHLWDIETESASIVGAFERGAIMYINLKDGHKLKMELVECVPNQKFTDLYKFPLAKMYGAHSVEEIADGVRISTTFKIEGPLSFLWRKLVVEKVAASEPEQTELLIKLAASV